MKLIVVAAALLFAQLQCVAACARQSCNGATAPPPCHRQHNHQHDRACPNQLLVVAKHTGMPMFSLLSVTQTISAATPADAGITALNSSAFSPPRLTPLFSLVLRI